MLKFTVVEKNIQLAFKTFIVVLSKVKKNFYTMPNLSTLKRNLRIPLFILAKRYNFYKTEEILVLAYMW